MDKKHLIILAGLPGTGKTTSAKKLVENFGGYELIIQNDLRRSLGMKKLGKTQERVLRTLDKRVNECLSDGCGVIIDSVHRYLFRRHQLYGIASGCGTNVITIETKCSEEEAKRRMLARQSSDNLLSDPRSSKVYHRISQLWEEIDLDFKYPGENHVSYMIYDTEKNQIYKKRVTLGMKSFVDKIKYTLLKY